MAVCLLSFRAAYSCKRDAKMATKEVAERVAQNRRACGPRAALQDAMISVEPDFGIFRIWIRLEPCKAFELIARPFPHVACHIQTTARARSFRKTPNGRRAPET